uniref:Tetraspanin n=1 Tax=Ciona intestinalis TaxID=7719 RepID=F7AY51_CIOIN|nr:tetraspanin-9-like [Ciona intestinalis]|eukprot:XP_002120238.1 tetraspanin-9-like [Ciona intestinalis]
MKSTALNVCKWLMFTFNLIITICGAVLLAFGIWAYANGNSFRKLVSANLYLSNSMALMMAVGSILIIAGLFGCIGSLMENRCMLGTFFTIVLILFVIEVVSIILLFVYWPKAETLALNSIHHYDTDKKIPWDYLQRSMKCCGYTSYTDWGSEIPSSCCFHNQTCTVGSKDLYVKGCRSSIQHYIFIIAIFGVGALLFELLAIVFTCVLYQSIGDYQPMA